MFRIVGKLLHPIAQLRHMHAQVLRSLHIGHASLLDQAHSLKLELACKLSSLHDTPPAPSKHLTRCLRNRVQAIYKLRWRIESAFNRLKDFRRIATRYDRLARNYLASVCLAAALVWWI